MGGYPFNIEVFLRPEGEKDNKFRTEDFVTNVFNFSQPSEQDGKEVCSNCKEGQERDVQVTAYIPVTSYLIKMFKQQQLSDLEPTTVESVLARMYWRITDLVSKSSLYWVPLTDNRLTTNYRTGKPSPKINGGIR